MPSKAKASKQIEFGKLFKGAEDDLGTKTSGPYIERERDNASLRDKALAAYNGFSSLVGQQCVDCIQLVLFIYI